MANWNVIENGVIINTIVADEAFATKYAEETGYTLEKREEAAAVPTALAIETTDAEMAAAILEGVNEV